MKPKTTTSSSVSIVYDADRLPAPGASLFDAGYWREQGRVSAEAPGRAGALFIDTSFGSVVLKHYLRGGQMAKLSRDRYLFTGYRRSRPHREFELLSRLLAMALPVPAPVAALCRRGGITYRGALITMAVPGAVTLADRLGTPGHDAIWRACGRTIARFHRAGLEHADLNLRNILVSSGEKVFLIDFDKSRLRASAGRWQQNNIRRLKRSYDKFCAMAANGPESHYWQELEHAYRDELET